MKTSLGIIKWLQIALLPVSFLVIFLHSCSDDSPERESDQPKTPTLIKGSDMEQMDKEGYQNLKKNAQLLLREESNKRKRRDVASQYQGTSPNRVSQEKITKQHLVDLFKGDPDKPLMDIYKDVKFAGFSPNGVAVNDYKTYWAFSKYSVPDKYGWYAYIELGKVNITILPGSGDKKQKSTSVWVYNYSDSHDKQTLHLEYKEATTITSETEVTVDFSVGMKAKIPIGELSFEQSFGFSSKRSEEHTEEHTVFSEYEAEVPPHSKRRIVMVETIQTDQIEYEVPINITGDVALTLPFGVENFGTAPASKILEGKPNKQVGTITCASSVDYEVYAEAPIPIT